MSSPQTRAKHRLERATAASADLLHRAHSYTGTSSAQFDTRNLLNAAIEYGRAMRQLARGDKR